MLIHFPLTVLKFCVPVKIFTHNLLRHQIINLCQEILIVYCEYFLINIDSLLCYALSYLRHPSATMLLKHQIQQGGITIEPKHHMHFEMTADQYQQLSENAKACSLSKRAYLIRLIQGHPPKARNDNEMKAPRREIHAIGNNINQIARSLNTGIAPRRMPENPWSCWDEFTNGPMTWGGADGGHKNSGPKPRAKTGNRVCVEWRYKTQEQVLTAHLNCDSGFEYQQMMNTKRELGKLDERQCYHIIQSFVPGEITPELAFQRPGDRPRCFSDWTALPSSR